MKSIWWIAGLIAAAISGGGAQHSEPMLAVYFGLLAVGLWINGAARAITDALKDNKPPTR